MANRNLTHKTIASVEIEDGLKVVISKTTGRYEELGYTIIQKVEKNGHTAFLKGTDMRIKDKETLLNLRNAINVALEE